MGGAGSGPQGSRGAQTWTVKLGLPGVGDQDRGTCRHAHLPTARQGLGSPLAHWLPGPARQPRGPQAACLPVCPQVECHLLAQRFLGTRRGRGEKGRPSPFRLAEHRHLCSPFSIVLSIYNHVCNCDSTMVLLCLPIARFYSYPNFSI